MLIDADPKAMLAFGKLQGIVNYRKNVPPAVYAAAGLTAVMQEDCGPCTQLAINTAQHAGVEPAVLRAIVTRDLAALPTDIAQAFPKASPCHRSYYTYNGGRDRQGQRDFLSFK